MKTQKGLTLVSVAVTIIVLFVLSGISLSIMLGDNGIIGKARKAKEETMRASAQEELKLLLSNETANYYQNGTSDSFAQYLAKNQSNLKVKNGTVQVDNNFVKYIDNGNVLASVMLDGTIVIAQEIKQKQAPRVFSFFSAKRSAPIEYNIGDVVKVGNEEFYVLKESSISDPTVTLLAKYNLKEDGKAQDASGAINPVKFSSNTYWAENYGDNKERIKSGQWKNYDYYDIVEKSELAIAMNKADDYAKTLDVSATGRLIRYSEVLELESINTDILYGINKKGSYLNYWTGSAWEATGVWEVMGESNSIIGHYCNIAEPVSGVRPVIEISKIKITK